LFDCYCISCRYSLYFDMPAPSVFHDFTSEDVGKVALATLIPGSAAAVAFAVFMEDKSTIDWWNVSLDVCGLIGKPVTVIHWCLCAMCCNELLGTIQSA
jgi:hypothetical protein